ncbi:MAG: hypothetical protein ABWY93_22375, partial [Mycobacterium sp.]
KTGDPPRDGDAARHAAIQLAVYRLAWAGLHGCDEASVRAVFHYVRSGRTVQPDVLAGPQELAALLEAAGSAEAELPRSSAASFLSGVVDSAGEPTERSA